MDPITVSAIHFKLTLANPASFGQAIVHTTNAIKTLDRAFVNGIVEATIYESPNGELVVAPNPEQATTLRAVDVRLTYSPATHLWTATANGKSHQFGFTSDAFAWLGMELAPATTNGVAVNENPF